ncbi:MAG: hypothetical protein IJH34_16915, partial [Romboutsia sp.]|nr:hypothetical protein [Romboutsia sp.]
FKLDLSKGIYVYQIYHCDLSRLNSDNAGKTDDGCYDNAINKMNQRKCSVTFFRKGSNEKKTVFSAFELSLYKNDIDWNRLVFLIDTKPEKYDSDRWNDEIQGYWLILSKLTTKEQAEKYEYNKHVLKPLHTFMKYKIMVDRCIINGGIHSSFSKKKDITLKSMLKDYGAFSYHYINKIFNDGSLLKRILKYWKKFFNLDSWVTFRNDLKKVFSGTLLIYGECEDFFDGLVLKFAKMLDIDCTSYIEKLRNKKRTNQTYYNIQCPDFFYDYEVLQKVYQDERYKKSDYVNYIKELSILDTRDSISNNKCKFYDKPSYAYDIKWNYDDGENMFSDFASFSFNAY